MDRANQDKELVGQLETGHRLIDHVDLIAGTSTGGILAIALAMGKNPAEVCDFYRSFGPKIFPKDPLRFRALLQLLRYKYNPKPLRDAIESVVGSKPLREACCGLVIPAIDVNSGNIRLFKTDHHADTQFDTRDVLAVDAALATSAAPTYFPAHQIKDRGTYIDGGLWANCPAMVGLTEAVAYLGYNLDEVRLLSISTTSVPYHLSRAKRVGGILLWAKPVIEAQMRFQIEGSWSEAKSLLTRRGGAYLRIDQVAPDGIFSLDNVRMVQELIAMGASLGRYDTHYRFFREHFLTGANATLHRCLQSPS
jgi:patatin-like phospholipase/acyl hydrolase